MVSSLYGLAAGSAGYSQQALKSSGSRLQASIAALASGKRLVQASTDIAALSIATGLQSQLSGLRGASTNIAQASSLLQVADGGLNQIGNILDRLQALSTQANSGILSDAGRKGLDQEFQALVKEVDRLAGTTNFNGINLLDGSVADGPGISTDTTTATQATATLSFTGNIGAGQTLNINGVTLTEGVDFGAGATIQQTLDNVSTALNSSTNTALSGASYQRVGNSLVITADAGGEAGNNFTINRGASTASGSFTVVGNQIGASNIYSLQGGADDGLSGNSVVASGVVGDSLVTGQSQTAANTTLSFTSAANIVAGDTINIDDGNGGFINFQFVNGPPASNTQIQIGATLEDTLENAAGTFENYTGNNDFGIRQLDFSVNGNDLVISNSGSGNPTDAVGAALNVTLGTTGGTISATTLNNGTTGGINTSGVTNEAFTGTIQGFSATFNSSDNITASITVGGETYTANIADTTPGANTTVRFSSANGGFFDVQLAGGQGQAVTDQNGANQFADRLDAAFSGLSFSQNRNVSNFTGVGQLNGASVEIQGSNFNNLSIDSINVTPSASGASGNATVEIVVNGETFRSSNLGTSIGAGESVKLTSVNDPNKVITFNNGVNQIDLSSNSGADTFKQGLQNGFGVSSTGGLTFQVGADGSDTVNIKVGDVSSNSLFGGKSLNLLSQANASIAFSTLGDALGKLTSARADVGASQANLNYTAAALETAILNQDAARSVLEDTDVAQTSTENLLSLLQQNVAIATQAQTNRLAPSLLKLLVGS